MTDAGGVANADKSRELKLRIASAVVIAPVALGLTWAGGVPFAVLVVVCGLIMASEWATIVLGRSWSLPRLAGLGLTGLAIAASAFGGRIGLGTGGSVIVVAALVGAIALAVVEARGRNDAVAAKWAPWGPLYAAVSCMALDALRAAPNGLVLVIFLFAVVWSTDIAAYFTGRALGGPKLWPAVSPKKTWSGAIGGLVAAALAGVAVAHFGAAARPMPVFVVAAVLSIASQCGDLFESSLKRHFGVKDSGRIIPGHGGILDRVDGLVAAAVAAVIVAAANGGLATPGAGLLGW